MPRPRVVILTEILTHYRQRFFELLRDQLAAAGIDLVLVYGQPRGEAASKKDTIDLPWAHKIQNRILSVGAREVCWQPALSFLKNADLFIVEQASRLLMNYVLFAAQVPGLKKMAFWGHGQSFRPNASTAGETVKRFMSKRVHWWFAYNDLSAEIVATLGFPKSRITSVQNAIDTRALIAHKAKIDDDALRRLRAELTLKSDNVCLYVGGMYAERRLSFLLDACHRIRQQVPDFEMIFLGAGPEASRVAAAAKEHPWLHYAGAKFGAEAVPYFMLSKLLLMPGPVGLVILDALALELPLITTNLATHGPEIAYLREGHNGMIVQAAEDVEAYAGAVATLLTDDPTRQHLVAGCQAEAHTYTIESMADRFARGVGQALHAD